MRLSFESKDSKKRKEDLELHRYNLEKALLEQMTAAVAAGTFDPERVEEFKVIYGGLGAENLSGRADNLTHHEKVLDWWRILVTFVLVIVLAISVFLVVRQAKPSGAAAAYVSLVSGLTGIALGWMFANSGDLKRRE
jgi:hypothetical protein